MNLETCSRINSEHTTLPVDINRVLGTSSLFIVLAHLSPKYCISVAANVSAGVKRWCSFYAQKSFNDAPAQLHVFFRCKLINKTEILADNPDGVKVDNMQCVDIDVFKIVRPLRHRRICGTQGWTLLHALYLKLSYIQVHQIEKVNIQDLQPHINRNKRQVGSFVSRINAMIYPH